MVRSINGDGTLRFTNIGGPILPTLDGEYCRIITRDGKVYTGTILSTSPAVHVFKDASTARNIFLATQFVALFSLFRISRSILTLVISKFVLEQPIVYKKSDIAPLRISRQLCQSTPLFMRRRKLTVQVI